MRLHWRITICKQCEELWNVCQCEPVRDLAGWVVGPPFETFDVARVRLDTHAEHKDFVGDEELDADVPF